MTTITVFFVYQQFIHLFIVKVTAYPLFPNALFPLLTEESGIDAKLISEAEVGPSQHYGIRCQIEMAKPPTGQNNEGSPGLSHFLWNCWDLWILISPIMVW